MRAYVFKKKWKQRFAGLFDFLGAAAKFFIKRNFLFDAAAIKKILLIRIDHLGDALLLRPGAILTRAELEERIYGWNEEVESNAVDFLIHGVRKKLGADIIKNVRGAGWMVEKPT